MVSEIRGMLALRGIAMLMLTLMLCAAPAEAHHSFAMFDQTRTVTVDGTVSGFMWTNPHIFIALDVRGTNGKTIMYKIEGGSPSIHMRSGWKANSLKPGDHVKVTIYPLRSGEPGGRVKEVTTTTGTVFRLTSGTSATPGKY